MTPDQLSRLRQLAEAAFRNAARALAEIDAADRAAQAEIEALKAALDAPPAADAVSDGGIPLLGSARWRAWQEARIAALQRERMTRRAARPAARDQAARALARLQVIDALAGRPGKAI